MSPSWKATVLVLEQSAALQDLIDQALRDSGHRVLSTGSALEALELVRRVHIDVLVAGDLENHAETLVSELRAIQPSLEVVNISSPFALGDLLAAVDSGRLPLRQ